jgi:hypothetical protein
VLPFLAAGAVLSGGAVKGAAHAMSTCNKAESPPVGPPLRTATSRPVRLLLRGRCVTLLLGSFLSLARAAQLWATSTDSLDPIRLESLFGHGPSTADTEVRKAKAAVLAARV